jgi:hypothetical protein
VAVLDATAVRVIEVAYPEPTPVLKGKAAKELLEDLEKSHKAARKNKRWAGSRVLYARLSPKDDGN